MKDFEKALINARSVTTHVYAEETGGDQHCQLGASELWRCDFFDWVGEKFSLRVKSANKAMKSD